MTSSSDGVASAIDVIDRFIGDPAKHLTEWLDLHWGDDNSLCGRIRAALQNDGPELESDLRALLERTESARFEMALAHQATAGSVPGAEKRQRRNAEALARTALVALDAQRVANQGGELSSEARVHLAAACQLLHSQSQRYRGSYAAPPTAADATEPVRRAFDALESEAGAGNRPAISLSGVAAAQYWINAYWLNKDEGYNANRLELPTVTIHSVASSHFVGKFIAYARPTSRVAVLIEHPAIALLCLGSLLIDSIYRAWEAPDQKKTAVWKIDAHKVLAQDDESMSGAAAVVFQALAENSTLAPQMLVLARLNQDLNILERVGRVGEKIEAALKNSSLRNLSVVLGSAVPPSDSASPDHCGLTRDQLEGFRKNLSVSVVGNVRQALAQAVLRVGTTSHSRIGPYTLGSDLGSSPPHFELREADHPNEPHLILKAWHIDEGRRLLLRGSWDLELRTLYRVCSLPRAEELLLTLRDSFVTPDRFVLVMRTTLDVAPGPPHTLREALKNRSEHPWLQTVSVDSAKGRYEIWLGLRRIADGIRLLHSQNVVHRNLSAECVYFSGDLNDKSLRLGGFEWSARIGASPGQAGPNAWAVPPDAGNAVITIDTDWYGFGMLAARCFHSLEDLAGAPAHELNRRVAEIFSNDRRGQSPLTPHERTLIMELIRPDRANRLKDPARIVAAIDRALSHLAPQSHATVDADPDSALYVICNSREWGDPLKRNGDRRNSDRLKRNGFRPDKARPQADYDSEDPRHVTALKAWLGERFRSPILYRQPNGEFWLQGDRFALRVKSDLDPRNPQWTFAFADVLDSIGIPEQATFSDLRGVPIVFLVTSDDRNAFRDRRNWTPYLPQAEVVVEDRNQARETLVRFLRCTNQLDLLLCYAEIFPCDVVPLGSEQNVDRVRVTPRVIPKRGLPPWLRKANDVDLFSYFRQRLDGSSPEEKHVTLTRDDGIRVFVRDAHDDEWDLERIESMPARGGEELRSSSLILMRQGEADKPGRVVLPRGPMFIRASDHYGQVELIDRRGKAIEKVTEFRYLLNALASPKPVWMTTSIEKLPLTLDMETVDENKRSVLWDILSARPIYALQGPPGTGKTTLIAHLARQILQEDQTAQILITAQAHGAVERLQETLQRVNAGDDDNPALVVRLGIDDDDRADGILALPRKEGAPLSLREQAVAILQKASDKLANRSMAQAPRPSSVEADWILTLGQMIKASVIGSDASGADDFSAFKRLIRDGANIVLCTTSARDLEEIAAGDKTFDWSIIEEAGRVHGYDLALPMNVGHRWLLVGDQQQLEAYRYEQFREALQFDEMDESTELLSTLHDRNPDLVDRQWPSDWDQMKQTSNPHWTAQAFLGRAKSWLRTFDNIYKILKATAPEDKPTEEKEIGSAVGRLVNQYRMHPAIGTLVTQTYYRDQSGVFVSNRTGTIDDPSPKVLHGLDSPTLIKGLPIVWLDVPWCGTAGTPANAQEQRTTSYWNQAEIDLIVGFCRQLTFKKVPERPLQVAVLSQYMAQKNRLQTRLREAFPNGFGPGLMLKEGLYGRQRTVEQLRFTHTVDSFQGNEADVVIVSLTRNNIRGSLGFVKDAKRMNVLLSRAQRLLVLVGSWDFFQRQVDGLEPDVNWRHELAHIKRMLTILEEFEHRPVPAFTRLRWSDGAFRRVLR